VMGADLLNWQAQLAKHWPMLRFGSADVEQKEGQLAFQVQVFLDDLDPDAVRVELYAEGQNANAPVTHPLSRGEHLVGSANGFTYTALVPATRPAAEYTPRIVPQHDGAFVPLEAPFILWHDSPSWR
jgi:glycogen phosphorylase